jgi:protein TonB
MPCHASGKPKAGIDLTSYDSVMKGGREGAIVKAGDVSGSKLDMALHHAGGVKQMPPPGPLPATDIATIEGWIKDGAKNG